jgi:hypothetical protein
MLESTVIRELRRALRREGIWGQRATRLLQDWADHVHESTAQRIADGAPAEAAERAAWQALGAPHILASQAARQLAQASWLGRRPWLAGLLLPLGAWLAGMTILFIVVAFIIVDSFDGAHPWLGSPGALRTGELVFNWLPWLLSLAWLVRLARTLPGGWKHYWITAATLSLLTPSLFVTLFPPQPGFHFGHSEVGIVGLPGAILSIIVELCHMMPTSYGYPTPLYPGLIQTAISFAGLFALRKWSCSTFDRTPPRPA